MLKSLRKAGTASSARVSRPELAALADCTERMIEYRVGRKQLSPPGPDGRFDRARALAELAAKPKQKGGRKRGMKITPKTAEVAARESAPVLRDPATRFRLARAGQEEIRLAKMQGTVERVAVIAPRTFHLSRGDRDRLLAWVSRTAPVIAAEVRVDEGGLWRAMNRAVSTLLERMAAVEIPLEDEEHAEPRPQVEEDAAPVPRDADSRFQLARARQEEWKLARMRREHVDLGKATRRAVAFRRRTLDELAGWVARIAPTIAAEVGAEAAPLAHAMARHLGPLQAELAAVDVAAALRTDPPEEGDDAEGEAPEQETGNHSLAGGDARTTARPPGRKGARRHRRVVPPRHRTRSRRR